MPIDWILSIVKFFPIRDTKKGAEASAALYSLIVMAKAANKNPFDYLKMVFTLLPKAKTIEDIEKLLPWA